jgi:periplasmic divalent cation tolerance protein
VTEVVAVEITCPDATTASEIAESVLARRLAACAHLAPAIESRYHWKGRLERETEVPLVLKTRAALLPALVAAVRALHPYEVPAILSHPLAATPDYAAWVAAETAEPA